ncbi:MAG: hypothetical protein QW407_05575 [Thermofilaceae archaeon]
MSGELRYVELSDEEVDQLILQRLREIKELLKELRDVLKKASEYG